MAAPLVMNFNWAPRTTDPSFKDSYSGILNPEPNVTTLRYLNRTYSLQQIQFTAAAHTSWLPPTLQSMVREELTITFQTSDRIIDTDPKTCILVIPLVRSGTAPNIPYLKALSTQDQTSGQISPQDLVPSGKYAYYSVCSQGYASGDPPQYTQVIVLIGGLQVTDALMNAVYGKLGTSQVNPTFGPYQPPLGLVFSTVTTTLTDVNFPTVVKYAAGPLGTATAPSTATSPVGAATTATGPVTTGQATVSSADAYKCVSLNPETDISGGKLFIDPTTGVPLSQVDAERNAVKKSTETQISLAEFTDKVKNYISAFLAAAFILVFLYIVLSASGQIGVPGQEPAAAKSLFMKILSGGFFTIVIAIVTGFIGFIFGVFMK